MANYISIKGWLECEHDDIKLIKSIISKHELETSYDTLMDYEIRKLYNKGWHFQEEVINWTSYVFYGADIKLVYDSGSNRGEKIMLSGHANK